jgi:hypothetical protein
MTNARICINYEITAIEIVWLSNLFAIADLTNEFPSDQSTLTIGAIVSGRCPSSPIL